MGEGRQARASLLSLLPQKFKIPHKALVSCTKHEVTFTHILLNSLVAPLMCVSCTFRDAREWLGGPVIFPSSSRSPHPCTSSLGLDTEVGLIHLNTAVCLA